MRWTKPKPRVTSAQVAEACDVTPQAVNGWRKTGRVAKFHLPKIARLTSKPLEYFLEERPASQRASELVLDQDEALALKKLRTAMPSWRRYVLGLADIDRSQQELLLMTMRQTVAEYKVEPKPRVRKPPLVSINERDISRNNSRTADAKIRRKTPG